MRLSYNLESNPPRCLLNCYLHIVYQSCIVVSLRSYLLGFEWQLKFPSIQHANLNSNMTSSTAISRIPVKIYECRKFSTTKPLSYGLGNFIEMQVGSWMLQEFFSGIACSVAGGMNAIINRTIKEHSVSFYNEGYQWTSVNTLKFSSRACKVYWAARTVHGHMKFNTALNNFGQVDLK